jgi:hypothetical protein
MPAEVKPRTTTCNDRGVIGRVGRIVRKSSSALLAFPCVALGVSRWFNQRGPAIPATPLDLMLLLIPLSSTQEAFRSRAQLCRSLAKNASRRRSYLWFQTHCLHLKKIDGLGLQVIENSGGQATAEHQHGVKVDAIGLDVRHHCANGVWPCTTYFSCGALCFRNKSRIHILSASFCSFRRMPAAESSASELRRKGGSEPLRPDVDSALSPCALASIRALRRPFRPPIGRAPNDDVAVSFAHILSEPD